MQAEAAGGKVSGPLALWAGLVTLVPPHGAGAPAALVSQFACSPRRVEQTGRGGRPLPQPPPLSEAVAEISLSVEL